MTIRRINLQEIQPHLNNGATILVPNLRIKDAIISEHLNDLQKNVIPSPQVHAVDVFILECWNRNSRLGVSACSNLLPLSAVEEFLIWNGIVESSLSEIPLLNPGETAAVAARSYQTSQLWLAPDVLERALTANSAVTDIVVFKNWITEFREYCAKHQRISLVDCTRELTNLLREEKLSYFPEETVIVNFYDPPPLYEQLFAAIPKLESVFTINEESNSQSSSTKASFYRRESELHHCAEWAKNILADNPSAHIGLITCDKELEQHQLELIFKDQFTPDDMFVGASNQAIFNTTASDRSILDAPIIYDALLLLGLGRDQHDIEDIYRLLQSPFLNTADEEEVQQQLNLVAYLQFKGVTTISSRELSYFAESREKAYSCPSFANKLVKVRTEIRKIGNLGSSLQWSDTFEAILEIFDWPGSFSNSNENSLLKQWENLFSEFKGASNLVAPQNYTKALSNLRLLCSREKQRNSFDSSLALSYFTASDAIGLEFDYIWFLGLNDQQWPEPVSPSPFLPYDLQRSANIPGSHSDIQLTLAKTQFELLLNSARISAHASHYTTDGDQDYRPSNFIRDFKTLAKTNASMEAKNTEVPLQELNNKATKQLSTLPISTVIDNSTRLEAGEAITGGTSIISDQSACPFRAFTLNRLKAHPPPRAESGLSKMARGTALHIALEHLFAKIDSHSNLSSLDDNQIAENCSQGATKAIEWLGQYHREAMTPKFQLIEHNRIEKLLKKFVEAEKSRPSFQVIAREEALSQRFENFVLNVRIDRIDQLDDGAHALIDYKTGKHTASPKSWMDGRPEDMQLPLYHYIASSNDISFINAVVVAHLNAEKIGYSGIADSNSFSDQIRPIEAQTWTELSWNETTESWASKVEYFAAEFNCGVADVNPVDPAKTCSYCGLKALCRIQEINSDQFSITLESEIDTSHGFSDQ
jgi:ATP-dependent helicase/nuclease subunit B